MKAKKMRETRTAYRARMSKTKVKTRVVRPRAPKAIVSVPWKDRVAPTDEQLIEWSAWLNAHEAEFEEKYPGHYLAIWEKQIVAVAATRAQLYVLADQARPEVIPLVTYIPRAEDVFIVPSNFPAGWIEEANVKRAP